MLGILDRNLEGINSDAWLLGIPSTSAPLPDPENYFCTTFDAACKNNWRTFDINLGWIEPNESRSQIVLYLPKSKHEAKMLIDWAIAHLSINSGLLWIVGHNTGGIKSVPAMVKKMDLKATKVDSARHCAIFELTIDSASKPDTNVSYDQYLNFHPLENGLKLSSLPGVFSHGRFDIGTQLLLENLPQIKGSALDFGCGSGAIGCHILKDNPGIEVDFLDVSWLAIQSSKETVELNGFKYREMYCVDGISDISSSYRHILSNPPFHEGVKTNYDVTERFIKDAFHKLRPGGDITLVANQFLNYEAILKSSFGNCEELTRAKGFKILQAKKMVKRK